jgi:pimeloyl-ACP methyl ester carboxylesterase
MPKSSERPAPRLRRAYYECRYGQLHLHNAIPAGGGFDEKTALLCVPGTGMTGRVFQSVLAELGYDRSVYAFDLPGTGESDAAPGVPALDAALAALQDFLDTMRLREVDVLTLSDGGHVARLLATQRARQVRRIVFMSEPRPFVGPEVTQPVLSLSQDEAHGPARNTRLAEFLG